MIVPQPSDVELRQTGQFGIGLAHREHQRDRLGQQAAPDEAEDLSGGPVEPLRVVHHA